MDFTPSSKFEKAAEKWQHIEAQRREIESSMEGMQLALSLARSSGDASRVPPRLLQAAEPYRELAEKDPDRLIKRIISLGEDYRKFRGTLAREFVYWDRAKREETHRRAALLVPAHRKAVAAIDAALEALSAAIAAERAIRAQCGPNPINYQLPDRSSDLCIGTLDEANSRARNWRAETARLLKLADQE